VAVLEAVAGQKAVASVLHAHPPFAAMLGGDGARARKLFDRAALPPCEQPIRQRLKRAGLWRR